VEKIYVDFNCKSIGNQYIVVGKQDCFKYRKNLRMKNVGKIIVFALLLANYSLSLLAQNYAKQNVVLLGHWHNDTILPEPTYGIRYQSVWGYENKVKGEKYAIIGSTGGTYFIEITNPTNPVLRDYVPGRRAKCIWREYKSYGNYLYMVSDDGVPNSLQIADMSYLPDSVHIVHDADSIISRSHTIFIDNNKLYCGAPKSPVYGSASMAVYSLADPTHPVLLRRLNQDYPTPNYVHDMLVRNDTIYASSGYDGLFIYNFNSINTFSLLASLTSYTEQGYNHSSALTTDGKTLVFCDEMPAGKAVKVLDISDIPNLTMLTTFRSAPLVTPHNPYIIGNDKLFIAYYQDGLQVYNVANPLAPFRSGYFDTDTLNNASNGYPQAYHGCWGAYVDFGSGLILASDMQNGLYVLDASAAVTGINSKYSARIGVRISPNPVSDRAIVEFTGNNEAYTFTVFDVMGNEVKHMNVAAGYIRIELLRDNMPAGIYFYQLIDEEKTIAAKGKLVMQ